MTEADTHAWQPIDTVTPDSPVLVYTKPWGPIIATYSSEHGEWLSRMQVPVSIKEEAELPTHWQALPESPPEIASEAEGGETGAEERAPVQPRAA